MSLRALIAAVLGAAVIATPAPADDELDRALAAIKSVRKEGKGNEDAGPAWKTVVGKGEAALLPALEAFDDANRVAANWLRTAVDAIAESETNAGRKLPADKLETFALNSKYAPSARRKAYELLLAQDAGAKARLLPRFLDDKSAELRRDAIAHQLEILEEGGKKPGKADLEKLFALTRDQDQIELLAKKLVAAGGKANVTEHFGFVNHASLIGPFDGPDGKGFETPHPPEKAVEANGTHKGKSGAEVAWKPVATTDKFGSFDLTKLLDKHKDAVAYALAVVVAPKQLPCEIRVTSPNSVKVFLNGVLAHGHDEYHHGAPFDGIVGRGVLKPGENVVVLKVCQNDQKEEWAQAWEFQMRICDETGGPLPLEQKITRDGNIKTIKLGYNPNPTVKKEEKK
jgi:hypothetical protein